MSDHQLTEELFKLIIRKSKKKKVHLTFIVHIWGADLADMQLISKFNKGIRLYYVLFILPVNTHGLFL